MFKERKLKIYWHLLPWKCDPTNFSNLIHVCLIWLCDFYFCEWRHVTNTMYRTTNTSIQSLRTCLYKNGKVFRICNLWRHMLYGSNMNSSANSQRYIFVIPPYTLTMTCYRLNQFNSGLKRSLVTDKLSLFWSSEYNWN